MTTKTEYLNPDQLLNNPAFSQVVITKGNGKTIYISGQNAVNSKGEIIGKGEIDIQTEQVMKNLEHALAAAGAAFEHLIKISIFVVQGNDMGKGFQASKKYLGKLANPPALCVLIVSGLANPDFLVEVEAVAFISE